MPSDPVSSADRSPFEPTLLPLIYDELRRLAAGYMRSERSDHTLQPTALVHEVYLKLQGQHSLDGCNRAEFFGVAARMMRRILINHATARHAIKRGAGMTHLSLDAAVDYCEERTVSLPALDHALRELELLDPRQGQIVELRFFGGLTVEEAAEMLGISPATVKREWATAKRWLRRRISQC